MPPDPIDDEALASALPPPLARLWARRYAIAYLILTGWFIGRVADLYDPGTGFTSMPMFGDRFRDRRLHSLKDLPIYTHERSDGYDGQFYAQIAVAGNPFDPELHTALDSAGYRGKRAFLPLLAHVVGLGRPFWVINVYALMGAIAWLGLACALARWWFPPTDLQNLLRWSGTLFGAGMMVSVTRSLTDGAALLLIATGVRAVERGRRWLAAGTLALAGLARETSILCGVVLAPRRGTSREIWIRAGLAGLICFLPAVIWSAILRAYVGGVLGHRNFDWPLVAFFREVGAIAAAVSVRGFDLGARAEIRAVVAVIVQAAVVLSRPKAESAWWRIGATFAVLCTVLGSAVWEDPEHALARAVLPLTLAFNVVAPRTRVGLVLVLAGNLTALSADSIAQPPPQNWTLAEGIWCESRGGWFQPERLGRRTWRWASAAATLGLHNPDDKTKKITLELNLSSETDRTVRVETGELRQSIVLPAHEHVWGRVGPFLLPPGETSLLFSTSEPPSQEPGPHGRGLTFSLREARAIVEDGR